MTDETEFKELSKNRAYLVYIGGVEILALKLEGFKATQLGGTLSPMQVGVGGMQVQAGDWLLIVKDKNQITMPYDVWGRQVAQEISKATGSSIATVSVASNATVAFVGSASVKPENEKS